MDKNKPWIDSQKLKGRQSIFQISNYLPVYIYIYIWDETAFQCSLLG